MGFDALVSGELPSIRARGKARSNRCGLAVALRPAGECPDRTIRPVADAFYAPRRGYGLSFHCRSVLAAQARSVRSGVHSPVGDGIRM